MGDIKGSTSGTTETTLKADKQIEEDTTQKSKNEEEESDCVFNSDYKGLTTDWLTKVGKTNFVWRTDLDQASIAMGQDTIYVSKGGCEQMGLLVELRLNNDGHTIADSTFWLSKALTLATEFGLTHYEQMIREKKTKRIENRKNVVWFEIEDDNQDDNLYYNGVEINLEKKSKVISLSQYYN
jgi:hypothetical protein